LQTIELEKKAKMHIADSFRVAVEEKDDLINVLKTQVMTSRSNKYIKFTLTFPSTKPIYNLLYCVWMPPPPKKNADIVK
jgi:hypothetical protein